MAELNSAIIACNLSQKHNFAIFLTQIWGSKNYKILVSYFAKHLNTLELAYCVIHVLPGFMVVCLKTQRSFSLPWKHHEDMSCCYVLLFGFTYPFHRFPFIFPLCCRCIYLFYNTCCSKFIIDTRDNTSPWFNRKMYISPF